MRRTFNDLARAANVEAIIILALLGLRHSTFEATTEGMFYTPNKWFGLGVTAIFLGRLAARLLGVSGPGVPMTPGEHGLAAPQPTALTLGLLYLLASYYVAQDVGVLRRARAAMSNTTCKNS